MSKDEFKRKFRENINQESQEPEMHNTTFTEYPSQFSNFNINLKSNPPFRSPSNTLEHNPVRNIQEHSLVQATRIEPVETLQKPSRTFENPPAGERRVTDKKPKKFFWRGVVFLVAILAFGVAGTGVYASANRSMTDINNQCQNLLQDAANKGIETDDIQCRVNSTWNAIIAPTNQWNSLESANEEITKRKEELEKQINQDKAMVESTKFDLNQLEVQYNKTAPKSSQNLASYAQELSSYLDSLQKIRAQELTKLKTTSEKYQLLVKSYDRSQESDKEFAQQLEEIEDQELIKNHTELQEKYTALKNSVINNFSNAFLEELLQYKYIDSDQMHELTDSVTTSPGGQSESEVSITGDVKVDQVILKLAQKRGFKKRLSTPESKLVTIDQDNRLLAEPKRAWEGLLAQARKDNISLVLTSAYRSVADQKELFNERFQEMSIKRNGRVFTKDEILKGKADETINETLKVTAIPRHSKHHSGITIDLADITNAYTAQNFGESPAYKWISANNFLIAKRYGFVPSYPSGSAKVGPEPEPWEFVWVGKDRLVVNPKR